MPSRYDLRIEPIGREGAQCGSFDIEGLMSN